MEKRYYCPKCKHEINTNDKTCPNCHNLIENGNILCKNYTQIISINRNTFVGWCFLVISIVLFGLGGVFLNNSLPLLGFGGIIIGGFLLSRAFINFIGTRTGKCPYCGEKIQISADGKNACPSCQNDIIIKGNYFSTGYFSVPFSIVDSKSNDFATLTIKTEFKEVVKDSSRYYQSWNENYDKKLGYEWFKICTEYINYPDYNPLSERLAKIREAQGFTQEFVSNQTGLSQGTISNYENGNSKPSESTLNKLAKFYEVPKNFLSKGIGNDLISHYKLCKLYGENAFVDSLRVSILSALKMFFDLLTDEDINLCVKLDNELNLGIGFEDTIKKRKTKKDVTEKLISILISGDIDQTSFYSSLGENRQVGINVVKELSNNGIIVKIPHDKTYILHLNKSSDFALDCKFEETEE